MTRNCKSNTNAINQPPTVVLDPVARNFRAHRKKDVCGRFDAPACNDLVPTVCGTHNRQFADPPSLVHDDGSVFYYNYVNVEIRVPHCDDVYEGALGQTYKCKYVEQREAFRFDNATEESFRVDSLAAHTSPFDADAAYEAKAHARGRRRRLLSSSGAHAVGQLAVESKRWLNAQGQADALVGGERDFVIVSDDAPSSAMRVGTSVFTDGVEWYFARMAWRFSDRGGWKRAIKMSPTVDVTASGGWLQLARWFAFAFDQAVTTPREPTGLSQIEWTVGNADSWHLADVLSSGDRSIVSRWHKGPATAIVKFAADGITEARDRQIRQYFAHERAMLRTFAATPAFVHINVQFPAVDAVYVALEDGGASLASFNIRGAAGRALAKVVHQHIWVGALAALKEAKLCHFDITEHNVVVAADRASAKLIDLESVTGVGQSAAASPTAAIKEVRPAVASVEFDEQCVCAILRCLWTTKIASFEERAAFVAQFGADEERQRLLDEVAST